MNKHTPGPWTRSYTNYVYQGKDSASKGRIIAICEPSTRTQEDWDQVFANARLIAAAPELEDTLWAMVNAARKLSVLHNDSDFDEVDYAHDLYEEAEQMFHNVINKIKG